MTSDGGSMSYIVILIAVIVMVVGWAIARRNKLVKRNEIAIIG